MPASPFDSEIYRELLCDDEIAARFDDAAVINSWLRVEGALAAAQGELGLIPEDSARAIASACDGVEIDPAALASGTGRDGIPIPALVDALRSAIGDPAHANYLHFGATTQDIMDTGLVLRLGEVCDIVDARLVLLLQALADLAERHAELPLAARTRRMPATPTSFGAVVAAWGAPLLGQRQALAQLRPRLLRASLGGASGNSAALGPRAAELRDAFAGELGLDAGDGCWHSDRAPLAEFASCLSRINGLLAKMAEDCLLGAAPEVGELRFAGGGGSSTMPHKQNPVQAETMASLFQFAVALDGAMTQALLHRQQRDGAAWMLEWHALPQLCIACGRALELAAELLAGLEVEPARMLANLEGAHGLVYAEAISFRLAQSMPRSEAQARVKQFCAQALEQNVGLVDLVAAQFADGDWLALCSPQNLLGDAAQQARAFAGRVRDI